MLADPQAHSSQEVLAQQALVTHTHRALADLSPREAEVIRRRYGLHGKAGETLRQIGEDLHLSHERMRQIEAEALAKLRLQAPRSGSSSTPRLRCHLCARWSVWCRVS